MAITSDGLRAIFGDRAVVRPRDLSGAQGDQLYRYLRQGLVKRIARGLYVQSETEGFSQHQSMIEVAARVPSGVICLLSALRFHGLTTQAPFEVWVAIDYHARRPNIPELPVRIVRFSGTAFSAGIEPHLLSGVTVRVFSAAKTVADCFKYRNKIGLDVAIEALRDCLSQRKATVDDLWRYAAVCRVANVMRPYLETLTQ